MSNTKIFNDNILTAKIKLNPRNVNKNYQKYILSKLQKEYEGKFSKFGLIKEETIKLLKVSLGGLEQNSFEGNVIYEVLFNSKICNPVIGDIVLCEVINANNFGILCSAKEDNKSIIDVIIPKKSIAVKSDIDLSTIKIGMTVFVEIIGRKPILNDTKIKCIGKIIKTKNRSRVVPTSNEKNIEQDEDIITEDVEIIEYDDEIDEIDDDNDNNEDDEIDNDDDDNDDDDNDDNDEDNEDDIDISEGGSIEDNYESDGSLLESDNELEN